MAIDAALYSRSRCYFFEGNRYAGDSARCAKRRNWPGPSSEPASQYGPAFPGTGLCRDVP
jgi:hypothetical protein